MSSKFIDGTAPLIRLLHVEDDRQVRELTRELLARNDRTVCFPARRPGASVIDASGYPQELGFDALIGEPCRARLRG